MSSLCLEDTMKNLFQHAADLSPSQTNNLTCASVGMLLAGSTQLSKIARWLHREGQQDSRIQYLGRLLDSDYLTPQRIYQPLVRQALRGHHPSEWHLILDRSTLDGTTADVLMVALNFRHRAIPLVWQVNPLGGTSAQQQVALLAQVRPLLPPTSSVIVHGDSEFGSVDMMRFVRAHQWHFILGQSAPTLYRLPGSTTWRRLDTLTVPPRQGVYVPQVEWTQQHRYGPINLFAFHRPYQNSPRSPRREIRYYATSLPIAHTLRQRGRRRWGIECLFRDCKSSGWNIEASEVGTFARYDSLLTLLAVNYLWATCMGRWLCKTGHRFEVDARSQRHLSLFRIGWDWLIHQSVLERPCPPLLTLYA